MLSLPPSPYPTSAVRELAGCSLHNPLYIDAAAEVSWRKGVIKQVEATEALLSGKKRDQTPSQLQQFCSVVPCKLRLVALAACLLHHCNVRFSCHLSLCHCLCMYVCADVCVYVHRYTCMHVCLSWCSTWLADIANHLLASMLTMFQPTHSENGGWKLLAMSH